jgi:hypothetical protein
LAFGQGKAESAVAGIVTAEIAILVHYGLIYATNTPAVNLSSGVAIIWYLGASGLLFIATMLIALGGHLGHLIFGLLDSPLEVMGDRTTFYAMVMPVLLLDLAALWYWDILTPFL